VGDRGKIFQAHTWIQRELMLVLVWRQMCDSLEQKELYKSFDSGNQG